MKVVSFDIYRVARSLIAIRHAGFTGTKATLGGDRSYANSLRPKPDDQLMPLPPTADDLRHRRHTNKQPPATGERFSDPTRLRGLEGLLTRLAARSHFRREHDCIGIREDVA